MLCSFSIYRNLLSNSDVASADVISVAVTKKCSRSARRGQSVPSWVMCAGLAVAGREGYSFRVTDSTVNTLIDMAGLTYQRFSHSIHTQRKSDRCSQASVHLQ